MSTSGCIRYFIRFIDSVNQFDMTQNDSDHFTTVWGHTLKALWLSKVVQRCQSVWLVMTKTGMEDN